ncbi:hypothetical protein BTUL_0071g00440 [Botrytis tulipae]|uniref:Uncharacterized protein n=1 Tax=Botrytis tulipae TaxID=87230 RepID=A0A4Z1ELQ1_9HELO|nr:hypothetical protein BTUL_0071g00440 [Botrytis tulipae]
MNNTNVSAEIAAIKDSINNTTDTLQSIGSNVAGVANVIGFLSVKQDITNTNVEELRSDLEVLDSKIGLNMGAQQEVLTTELGRLSRHLDMIHCQLHELFRGIDDMRQRLSSIEHYQQYNTTSSQAD